MSETTFLAKEWTYKKKQGCEGYTPANPKSFLEDAMSFKALSAESAILQSDWTKFDQTRAKGKGKGPGITKITKGKHTKSTSKKDTTKTKSTKAKTPKVKKTKTKKSFLEDPAGFYALVEEKRNQGVSF